MKKARFVPTICVTHNCNLNCIYCYQKHDTCSVMSFDVARQCIDYIFANIPSYAVDGVELGFIGGEPLLEFDLIKRIYQYSHTKYPGVEQIYYATTNGTVLSQDMKRWFSEHRDSFVLGLSLDGTRECHNLNRSNSFDKIDIEYFLRNWPEQGVKMTLSEHSIPRLAENIKYLHSLGFKGIHGVNLAEGDFDWDNDKYIRLLIPQLSELVDFYLNNDDLTPNQMFDKPIEICEVKNRERKKWCGIGTGCPFFDVDGKKYPCTFITPMTFSPDEIADILSVDYSQDEEFIDDECFSNCYLYPICSTCSGANYMRNKSFKKRDKTHCKIQKLISLYIADLYAKKIAKNPSIYDDATLFHRIEAIKRIRSLYLDEFTPYGI